MDLKRHGNKDSRIGEAKKQCLQEFKCQFCDKCYTTGISPRFFSKSNFVNHVVGITLRRHYWLSHGRKDLREFYQKELNGKKRRFFYTLKFLVHEKVVHSEPATSKPVTTEPATTEPATSSEQDIEVKIEEAEETQIIDLEEGDPKIIEVNSHFLI